jgi:hypothetical protein
LPDPSSPLQVTDDSPNRADLELPAVRKAQALWPDRYFPLGRTYDAVEDGTRGAQFGLPDRVVSLNRLSLDSENNPPAKIFRYRFHGDTPESIPSPGCYTLARDGAFFKHRYSTAKQAPNNAFLQSWRRPGQFVYPIAGIAVVSTTTMMAMLLARNIFRIFVSNKRL